MSFMQTFESNLVFGSIIGVVALTLHVIVNFVKKFLVGSFKQGSPSDKVSLSEVLFAMLSANKI